MTTAQVQTPTNPQRLTVKPSEIRSGDWIRDLGRLRKVTEDSGGKHGGGGSDTNDNKDDGHVPPGDKK